MSLCLTHRFSRLAVCTLSPEIRERFSETPFVPPPSKDLLIVKFQGESKGRALFVARKALCWQL